MVIGEASEDKETQSHSSPEEGGSGELQATQPHLHTCDGGGATNPGHHFQAPEGQGGDGERSAWLHKGNACPSKPSAAR